MDRTRFLELVPESLQEALAAAAGGGVLHVAYSGGLDSRFLCWCARGLGLGVTALTVAGPHVTRAETAWARESAEAMGCGFRLFAFDAARLPALAAAGRERCYVCKKALFGELLAAAAPAPLADGTNASDLKAFRPGERAVRELGVLSPLAAAGLAKADIRRLARATGMPRPEQAARPCLLTRFPYGALPALEQLALVERAEGYVAGRAGCEAWRFRLRFPGGRPALHVEASSIAAGDPPLAAVRAELEALEPGLAGLEAQAVAELSGFYDRPQP
ncbi:MAG: hypothetical protein HUK26_05530 [Duodenibacillus sp.]|nr:hypothetical protein [Duodenibacillus sp.]